MATGAKDAVDGVLEGKRDVDGKPVAAGAAAVVVDVPPKERGAVVALVLPNGAGVDELPPNANEEGVAAVVAVAGVVPNPNAVG